MRAAKAISTPSATGQMPRKMNNAVMLGKEEVSFHDSLRYEGRREKAVREPWN
jgi:hypothetical protein